MGCRVAKDADWKAVAAALGVSRQALQRPAREAAPWFPLAAVQPDNRGRLQVVHGGGQLIADAYLEHTRVVGQQREERRKLAEVTTGAKLAILVENLKQLQIQTRAMAREEARAEDNILPRAEFELFVEECMRLSREMARTLPKEMGKLVSRSHRRAVVDETRRIAERALNQLETSLRAGPRRV